MQNKELKTGATNCYLIDSTIYSTYVYFGPIIKAKMKMKKKGRKMEGILLI